MRCINYGGEGYRTKVKEAKIEIHIQACLLLGQLSILLHFGLRTEGERGLLQPAWIFLRTPQAPAGPS
jgi:hypothetical protein